MKPSTFQRLAWNGIQCSVPGDWIPSCIGLRHLMIESTSGPLMEIKWSVARGRFSSRKPLQQLSRSIRRQGGIFSERPMPDAWRKALRQFEATAFEWDCGQEGALGAIVFCPICRTASLIQFFRRNRSGGAEQRAVEVLATFRDHRADGRTAWQLYDISALLPGEFILKRYRFEAGRFLMAFNARRQNLILYRWAPAKMLLQDRSLAMLAETVSGGGGAAQPATIAGHPGVECYERWPDAIGRRLKAYLGISSFRRVRLWHLKDRNRILGAVMESRRPIVPALLDAVCDGYGMVDENAENTGADPG